MGTIIIIVVVVAAIFGIITLLGSDQADPRERAAEAAGAAVGGAAMAGGCMVQLMMAGLAALAGLWLLGKIFGGR